MTSLMGVQLPSILVRAWESRGILLMVGFFLYPGFIFARDRDDNWVAFVGFHVYMAVFCGLFVHFVVIFMNVEKHSTIVQLEQIVQRVEANAPIKPGWMAYLTRRYWRSTELPPKPSPDEVEKALQESEAAVGLNDAYLRSALIRLVRVVDQNAGRHELEAKVLEPYLRWVQLTQEKYQKNIFKIHIRLGYALFAQNNFHRSAEELNLGLDLYDQQIRRDPRSSPRFNDPTFFRKVLAIAYVAGRNFDAAEPICIKLLSEAEQKEGFLNARPLGTQEFRGLLIKVYIQQGKKALQNSPEGKTSRLALRYLRDALSLAAVHPSFYSCNLKVIGRFFVWAGRVSDAEKAFALANSLYEAGLSSSSPQLKCLCEPSSDKQKAHGPRACEVCEEQIGFNGPWFFCRSCEATDLCARCYADFRPVNNIKLDGPAKFPEKCLSHEFYEVKDDTREESTSGKDWIEEMVRELSSEIEGDSMDTEDWVAC